jgi:hypothetical protein
MSTPEAFTNEALSNLLVRAANVDQDSERHRRIQEQMPMIITLVSRAIHKDKATLSDCAAYLRLHYQDISEWIDIRTKALEKRRACDIRIYYRKHGFASGYKDTED